jgi:hypothetical protein
MAGFISDVARALAKTMAKTLRETAERRLLERGEVRSAATVLEILSADVPAQASADDVSWDALEAQAKQDLALVRRARSR